MNLFGFEIRRASSEQNLPSFTPRNFDDGAVVVEAGGVSGTYVDLDGSVRTDAELVNKYREIAQHPEVDTAIDEIVNEVIVSTGEDDLVDIILDDLELSQNIKDTIVDEFQHILSLLGFSDYGYEIFRRWYVDGRIYYHTIVDKDNVTEGIKELRYIDPRKIRKVRQGGKKVTQTAGSARTTIYNDPAEYYIYNDRGFAQQRGAGVTVPNVGATDGLKIAKDSILYTTSGLTNPNGNLVLSYVHKAIRAVNQLRSIEDSLIIYRISRAPERRVFYIDVGSLPKAKAEQYLRDVMTRFKNKVVYDSTTGEIRDDRKFMTMLEDYWLPRREGGRGTEITTLPGGQNLGEIEDISYFQRKLFKSLNVPIGRLESEATFNLGRATEITRDEVKFSKFVERLRKRFSDLFVQALEKQLVLKNIISADEWPEIRSKIKFKFAVDNYFAELKETEILNGRISALRDIEDHVGVYFSREYVRRHILKFSDDDIEKMDREMAQEKQSEEDTGESDEQQDNADQNS